MVVNTHQFQIGLPRVNREPDLAAATRSFRRQQGDQETKMLE
jgi:hypothetical protein